MSTMTPTEITKKCVAIVKFGPAGSPTDGFRAAEYFQVTIDPETISPSGEFIRFGQAPGDEIMGWQRAAAITVVEILGYWHESGLPPELVYGTAGRVTMPVLGRGD